MSQRLGIILIGLGLLLWGLYIQSKYEGFQGTPNTALAPPQQLPLAAPTTLNQPRTVNDTIDNSIFIKIPEINSKFRLITKIKLAADVQITKFLSDTDAMSKINIIYYEVRSFVNNIANIDLAKLSAETSLTKERDVITQLIYTASDQATLLYRIYFTIPSLIIASGTIMSSDTATPMSISDDSIIEKAAPQILKEVAGIPSAIEQLTSSKSTLITNANNLQKNYSDANIGIFQISLTKFLMIVDLEISNMDVKISNMGGTSTTVTSTPDIKLTNIINAKILFLNGVITTLKTVQDSINKLQNQNPGLSNSIETTISSYNVILTATRDKLVPKEGFQSHGNSYNTPSPNITQAYEFRLGKKHYTDDIFSGIKLFMP